MNEETKKAQASWEASDPRPSDPARRNEDGSAGEGIPPMKIDETVWIADGAKIIGDNIVIGAHSSVWYNAVIRSDEGEYVHIGERTNLQDLTMIHTSPGSSVTIGNGVTIGHSCIIHGCTVGDHALIGMGTILLDGCSIGKNALIGAGSLVTRNTVIPEGCMAFGRPAKVIRALTEDEIAANRQTAEHYVRDAGIRKERTDE